MRGPKALIACAATLGMLVLFPSAVHAEDTSAYARLCASCHGQGGRADTPVGRALKIPSFEGASFTRAQLETILRESKSHGGLEAKLGAGELEQLVETLNAMAAGA